MLWAIGPYFDSFCPRTFGSVCTATVKLFQYLALFVHQFQVMLYAFFMALMQNTYCFSFVDANDAKAVRPLCVSSNSAGVGWVGAVSTWYEFLWQFQLARAYMYVLCVSGAVNMQGFVQFVCGIHINSFIRFIESYMHTHTYTQLYTHTHSHTYMHSHTAVHTHTHTVIHTHGYGYISYCVQIYLVSNTFDSV